MVLVPYRICKLIFKVFCAYCDLSYLQSVLPYYVATKLSKIRKPTFSKPSPETFVRAAIGTVGLQSQTNGCLPHAIMVSYLGRHKDLICSICLIEEQFRIVKNKNESYLTFNHNVVKFRSAGNGGLIQPCTDCKNWAFFPLISRPGSSLFYLHLLPRV